MKSIFLLTAIVALTLVGCGGPPTPADVAGIYDFYSQNGEVVEYSEGMKYSVELKPDGIVLATLTYPEADISDSERGGGFSVGGETDGCMEIQLWEEKDRENPFRGTVCDDVLTLTLEEDEGATTGVWHRCR